jgi:acetylornithine/succinyldiaminopimelate/putrescine aminotransferase
MGEYLVSRLGQLRNACERQARLPAAARSPSHAPAARAATEMTEAILEVRPGAGGLLVGVQLAPTFDVAKVQEELARHGILVPTAGVNTVRLCPPLIIQREHIDELIRSMARALASPAVRKAEPLK